MPRTISSLELSGIIEGDGTYALLDVRERYEFVSGHIRGASPLPRGWIEQMVEHCVPWKGVPLIVYSNGERRGRAVSERLLEMGYEDVSLLIGGLSGWTSENFQLEKGWGVPGKELGEKLLVSQRVKKVVPSELTNYLNLRVPLLDVRSDEEFRAGHIPGAVNVPGGALPAYASRLIPDAPVIVTCAGRTRGILAALFLTRMGIGSAYALENGCMGWVMGGGKIETSDDSNPPRCFEEVSASWSRSKLRGDSTSEAADLLPKDWTYLSPTEVEERKGISAIYLVDVRLDVDYMVGHIPGSINLPAGQIALMAENHLMVRKAAIVVVGADSESSDWAAFLFRELGWQSIYVLKGGYAAWRDAGLALAEGGSRYFTYGVVDNSVFGLDEDESQFKVMSPRLLYEQSEQGEQGAAVIDVRGCGEYGKGHIPGSSWIPRGMLEWRISLDDQRVFTKVILVSGNGVRAVLAASTLIRLGFASVEVLEGGLQEWEKCGYPLEQGITEGDCSIENAQDDIGSTLWSGPLSKSKERMAQYLHWEAALLDAEN